MKETIRNLARSPIVTFPVRFVLLLMEGISRAWSVLKTAELFPRAPELPHCHWSVAVKFPENIELGRGIVIGPNCTLGAAGGIVLKNDVRLSEGVMVETAGLDFTTDPPYPHISRSIVIEEAVWIGAHAIILGGVTIGARSIIGAGAVVTSSVAADTVVSGPGSREWPRSEGRTQRGAR